jgi:hypothetical protein
LAKIANWLRLPISRLTGYVIASGYRLVLGYSDWVLKFYTKKKIKNSRENKGNNKKKKEEEAHTHTKKKKKKKERKKERKTAQKWK